MMRSCLLDRGFILPHSLSHPLICLRLFSQSLLLLLKTPFAFRDLSFVFLFFTLYDEKNAQINKKKKKSLLSSSSQLEWSTLSFSLHSLSSQSLTHLSAIFECIKPLLSQREGRCDVSNGRQ
jgi:hypothetical protein